MGRSADCARRVGAAVAFVATLFAAALAAAAPERQDVATMAPDDLRALQQRLTDAGCYVGPPDGAPSEATRAAVAACPDQRPQLRIEIGMHVANIQRVRADAQCRMLATASDDKTVRLWEVPSGRLIRTERLAIGAGDGGKMYALAVSPDGSLIAAGGWDAAYESTQKMHVYLFDAATGLAVRQLAAFGNVIGDLAFSPDGTKLAVGLYGGHGVRIVDVASGRELSADISLNGRDVHGLDFSSDGTLFAVGLDGSLRRYGPGDYLKGARTNTVSGREPISVAVDPSGRRVAVGFNDTIAVDVYDTRTLRKIASADTRRIANGDLAVVAWPQDGKRIYAGGMYSEGVRHPVLTFAPNGRRVGQSVAVADNTIMSLSRCGEAVAFAAPDPTFGLVQPDGTAVAFRASPVVDMRDKEGDGFLVSADGTRLRFGLGMRGATPVLFDLAKATLSDAPAAASDLVPPDVTRLPVTDWSASLEPRLNGQRIVLLDQEHSLSLAARPDGGGFVLGTQSNLRAYDASGTPVWPARDAPDPAFGVTIARGGALIVVAYGDGTIRWHRWSDGKELLALFVNKMNRTWVVWTPTGYYMASPGGEDMIGWHVNRGWDQAADFFPASKFRDQFFRPDIVERVLDTLDEGDAVKQADAARGGRAVRAKSITESLPPVLTIVSPGDGSHAGGSVKVDYSVRSPSGLPVDAIEALVDGRPVAATRGLERTPEETAMRTCLVETRGLGRVDGDLKGCRGSITITFPDGAKEIGLIARSGERTSEVARLRLVRDVAAASAAATRTKPRLYAVIVGVSAYANKDYTLHYPAKDAGDFASALENQKGASYSDVEVRVLTDGAATHGAIQDGFDWLSKHVTRTDVGVVFMAGHGVLDERGRFYFLAADSDADRLRATAVPRDDISDVLSALAGKALLFLDACHAGAITLKADKPKIDINGVVNDLTSADHGIVAFAASTGRQLSEENAAWGNGAFTKAVVEGLGLPGQRGRAAFSGSDDITTSGLDAYVSHRVAELTSGAQSPVMIRPATVPDFSLAVAR